MFHLLTVFPNGAAEQARYYIMNMLKKPQCISIHQFVQRVEKINSLLVLQPKGEEDHNSYERALCRS
jgi:hypothetical protein